MPIGIDPRFEGESPGLATQPVYTPRQDEGPKPSLLDTAAAASRQGHLAGALYERITDSDPDIQTPANYDPLDDIAGFEPYAKEFVSADSKGEVQGIKNRITSRIADQRVLARAGLTGTAAELGMTFTDPTFLASALVPELGMARLGRLRRPLQAAIEGGVGAAGYETAMQSVQTGRSGYESALNIGGGALLGGTLGTLLHRVPASEADSLKTAIDDSIINPVRSEVGAAASHSATTLEQEQIAAGTKQLLGATGKVPLAKTDMQVILESDSLRARQILQDLAEVPVPLAKNAEGIATPVDSVESRVLSTDSKLADLSDHINQAWDTFRARAGGTMSRTQFEAEIAGAARRGDRSPIPEVEPVAQRLRKIFDDLKGEAEKLGLFGEQKLTQTVGAESYFRRMYDRDAIRTNRAVWDETMLQHFMKGGGVDKAEARAAAEDVTRKILGADVGKANFMAKVDVPTAGPLKERVLDIEDAKIEPFLVNEPMKVARSYMRELTPQIEMVKRFGEKDMKSTLEEVGHEYEFMREHAREKYKDDLKAQSKRLAEIQKQETQTLDALIRIRDRVNGQAGRLSPQSGEGTRKMVQAVRHWRNLVLSSKLGMAALTSVPQDMARVAAQYGFLPTMKNLTKLVTSPEFRSLSKSQARKAGAAVEVALARRVQDAFDGAYSEGWSQTLAQSVYKYTGLNHWTDFARTLTATLLEDRVLKASEKIAAGKTITKFETQRLAQIGLGTHELESIAKEVAEHGSVVDGVRTSGSANWRDGNLARIYDAAILKESRANVLQPGAANRVWWMDSELGKTIGQLKTFSIGSGTSYSGAAAAAIGQKQYLHAARFMGFMMIGGYLAHSLRQSASGYLPRTNPGDAAREAWSESGMGGILPDILSPIGGMLTRTAAKNGLIEPDNPLGKVFGTADKYQDRNAASAIGGPSIGAFMDLWDVLHQSENGVSAKDLHHIRRLLPYQNVWYLRRMINALEGDTADALDLKGASGESTGDRILSAQELPPE